MYEFLYINHYEAHISGHPDKIDKREDLDSLLIYTPGIRFGTVAEIISRIRENLDSAHKVGKQKINLKNVQTELYGSGDIKIIFEVKSQFYFGKVGINELQGFLDENTGTISAKCLETMPIDVDPIKNTWTKLNNREEVPTSPAIDMIVLCTLNPNIPYILLTHLTYKNGTLT